ncbi:MAG TPA: AMP-binding protein, partial [Solirubrobacteraceae bacterium]|nr:AMP-binding protein [Solirubrobacteraceae bacterium]
MSDTAPISLSASRAAPATALRPRNLGEMVLSVAARQRGVALRYRRDGDLITVSYPEFGAQISEVGRGLIALGIEPGDRVAIFATTSADWTVADFGILCAGGVVTPVYHTNSAQECEYVLAHSGARAVFCGDAEQAQKVAQIRDRCPDLEHVIAFAPGVPGTIDLDALRLRGAAIAREMISDRLAARARDDLATIVYTSGTTGPPKGCLLTHGNMLETARMYAEELNIGEQHVLYSFLPLAHVLARVAQMTLISVGGGVTFWSGDMGRIAQELAELEPTHFPAVPRV